MGASLRSCFWRCFNRSQSANTIITILLLALMSTGVHISRYYEKNDELQMIKLIETDPKLNKYLNEDAPLEKILKSGVNIPDQILDNKNNKYTYSNKCSILPKLSDIVFDNKYWQRFNSSNDVSLYLYSAYYDKRKQLDGTTLIRINAMVNSQKADRTFFCKIWYAKDHNIDFAVSTIKFHEVKNLNLNLNLNTYILNCEIPNSHSSDIPFAVSVVENKCDSITNMLKINNNQAVDGVKQNFAVCVKGLDFPFVDKSLFIAEWIELHKILGVDKIFLYELNVHPNISNVLQHYINEDFVEVMPLSLPSDQPNTPNEMHKYLTENIQIKRAHEKLPYNDCFYKNINTYKFIANLDLDEIIIPRKFNTLNDLFMNLGKKKKNSKKKNPAAYTFKRFISLGSMRELNGWSSGIPHYMYILQNVYRSNEPEGGVKSVLATELVLDTGNHKPRQCSGGDGCRIFNVDQRDAFIWHFRSSCKEGRDVKCNPHNAVKDTNIWKYKEILTERTAKTLKFLNLI